MPVHLQPHVEQDVRRHARVAQPRDDVEHEAGRRDAEEQHDEAHQGREVAAEQRVVHRVGHERRPVAELEAVADGELVRQPVLADLPARRQRRIRLALVVEPRQASVELEQELDVGGITDEGRVKRSGGSGEVAKARSGRADGLAMNAAGECDEKCRRHPRRPPQPSHAVSVKEATWVRARRTAASIRAPCSTSMNTDFSLNLRAA